MSNGTGSRMSTIDVGFALGASFTFFCGKCSYSHQEWVHWEIKGLLTLHIYLANTFLSLLISLQQEFNVLHSHLQWATLVTHHLFRAHIFGRKCLNQTFSMNLYLLTFYLFDDIVKISKSLMRINLQRQMQFRQKCSCNLNVYIFYLRFVLWNIHDDRCDRKTPKTIILFK